MIDVLQQFLGVDFSVLDINPVIIYLTGYLLFILILFEVFNILRTVMSYVFKR